MEATQDDEYKIYMEGQKVGHYVWRLTSPAYIITMPEPISMIFGTLQHRFILNTSICNQAN